MNSIAAPVAVIADVMDSRGHPDRAVLQQTVEEVLASASAASEPTQQFAATVGDEFQAVFPDRFAALTATLHIQLALPAHVRLRFGMGEGSTTTVPSSGSQHIQDGPGWWRAREAVESAESQQTRHPHVRCWFAGPDDAISSIVNAYLLARDHILTSMSVSARTYAYGAARGLPQSQIAQASGVTQSAVSQSLRRSGGSVLLEGLAQITGT